MPLLRAKSAESKVVVLARVARVRECHRPIGVHARPQELPVVRGVVRRVADVVRDELTVLRHVVGRVRRVVDAVVDQRRRHLRVQRRAIGAELMADVALTLERRNGERRRIVAGLDREDRAGRDRVCSPS